MRAFCASLPRGIPAASLKRHVAVDVAVVDVGRLPRGIPAASLKPRPSPAGSPSSAASSAGNTRGLIEAPYLLVEQSGEFRMSSAGNTRGLIEASTLVHTTLNVRLVFRGEYPRPH